MNTTFLHRLNLSAGTLAVLGCAMLLASPNAHAQNKVVHPLEEFTELTLKGNHDVSVVEDGTFGLEILGEETVSPSKLPTVKGNALILDNDNIDALGKNTQVVVHCKGLRKIEVSGAADLFSKTPLTTSPLEISVSGAGDAVLDVNNAETRVRVSGAGDLTLTGSCNQLYAEVSGAGDLYAFNCKVINAEVICTGTGEMEVNVSGDLSGKLNGAGSINYMGSPKSLRVEKKGVGDLKRVSGQVSVGVGSNGIAVEMTDTTRFSIGDKRFLIIEDKKNVESNEYPNRDGKGKDHEQSGPEREVKDVWQGIELGVNGYATAGRSLGMPATHKFLELDYEKSIFVNLNLLEGHIKLAQEYVSIGTGAGLEINRYAFANGTNLQKIGDTLTGLQTGIKYDRNVLKMTWLTVPLFLEFNTSPYVKKSFHLALGVVGGYRLGSPRLKQNYEIGDVEYNQTVYGNYAVNAWRASLMLRLGYRRINFFASYALTPLFKSGSTVAVYPVSAGITLIPF
jgi:hypothetical protein